MAELRSTIKGFTLIELMITLAIAAILATLAAPSFQSTIRNNRTVTNANNLITSLNITRSEAIKRGVHVVMKRKGTTSKNWDSGWDIFADFDNNGVFNDDGDTTLCESTEDCLIKTIPALTNNYTLRTGNTYKDSVTYNPNGLIKGNGSGNDTFRLCDDTADKNTSRAIIVNSTGRARIETGTNSCP